MKFVFVAWLVAVFIFYAVLTVAMIREELDRKRAVDADRKRG